MNFKVCPFLILLGASCALAGVFLNRMIDEICGEAPECRTAAEKCTCCEEKKGGGVSVSANVNSLNKCLAENGQSDKQIKEEDCEDVSKFGENEKCKLEMLKLFDEMQESVASPIRCCHSRGLNSTKITSDGGQKLEYWSQKSKEQFTDQSMIDLFEVAYKSCLPEGTTCRAFAFEKCAISYCIEKLKE